MPHEPASNIGRVCRDCAPKPDPKYLRRRLEWFKGKFCKLAFATAEGQKEYMWVQVLGLAEQEGEELRGELCNDPVLPEIAADLEDGDLIEFSRKEIIETIE